MNLYEDLGVPKNADRATIKRAYRRKAQKLHPDRAGGDTEKFHAVQKAYDVLYDDARRAHYDAHGTDGQQDRQGDMVRRLAALFMQLIETQDVDHADIVGLMRNALTQGKQSTLAAIAGQHKKVEKYERAKKRLTKKGQGDNLLAQMLDGQISLVKRGIELGKLEIGCVEEMIKILADYQYAADKGGKQMGWPPGMMAFQAFGQQP